MFVLSSENTISGKRRGVLELIEIKAEIADWLAVHMKRTGLSMNEIAKRAGLGVATISRMADGATLLLPKIEHLLIVASVLKAPVPQVFQEYANSAGFEEPGLERFEGPAEAETNPNISRWTVRDTSLQSLGYMPGDIVVARADLDARDGDVVVCNLYSPGGFAAVTALRLYKAPYLVTMSPFPADAATHELGKNAAIHGVVVESLRLRKPH